MRNRSWSVITLFTILASLVFCHSAGAQEVTGEIRGAITDSVGAVVPGAVVVVTNADTHLEIRRTVSDAAGAYTAPLLPVGNYQIDVDASGFKHQTKTGIIINVGDRSVHNIQMAVGSKDETVTVNADVLQVQLDNAAAEGLITGEQVRGLPLNNRNYEQLLALQPGVSGNVPDQLYVGVYNYQNQTNVAAFSIGGGRDTQNNWTIDGADNVDRGSNRTLLNYPSVDAIAEFKTVRGTYDAEYGRGASGQVTVITRSGTQALHGSAYEFFRNDALDANSFFNNRGGIPRQPLRYNDFGGTIGGPLFIPHIYPKSASKTFFFFSEEMRRIKTPVPQDADVPTAALRNNEFPQPVCTSFGTDENGNVICLATATSVTVTPQAQAYLKDIYGHIPLPQGSGGDPFTLIASKSATFNYQEEFYRVDHQLNKKVSLMARFLNDKIPTLEPGGLFTGSGLVGVSTTATNAPGKSWVGRVTAQLSNSTFNEAGYAYSYGAIVSQPVGLDNSLVSTDVLPTLKLPYTSTLHRVPDLVFDNFDGVTGFGQYLDFNRNHNVFDNFSWLHGSHSIKFGMTYNHYNKNENSAGNTASPANGSFYFGEDGQPDSEDPFIGNYQEFANFLQGHVQQFQQQSKDLTADIIENSYEFYGQDEWRIRPNLTVSYGLRYSLFRAPSDGGGILTNFDPAKYNRADAIPLDASGNYIFGSGNPLNGIINGNHGSPFGGGVNSSAKTAIAPRMGVAWDPFKKGTTSIRAGYGIFQEPVLAGLWEAAVYQNPPYNSAININETNFAQPGGVAGTVSTTPPGLVGFGTNYHATYSEQFSFDVQHEIASGLIADIGYYGQHGVHLVGQIDINQVAPGAAVAAGIKTAGKPLPAGAATTLNPLRPYYGWGPISIFDPIFGSNYNSLQSQIKKRFTDGSLVAVNYTWSKALTDNQTAYGTQTQNSTNIRGDYGPMQIDRRNVFNFNYLYKLPFFQAQHGIAGAALGGWEFTGILTANSGLPLTIFQSGSIGDPGGIGTLDPSGLGSTNRPNLLFSPQSGAKHSFLRWYNPAAFSVNRSDQPGNEPRGSIRGPGYWRYDAGLDKTFKIYEKLTSQFRVEAFNLFNHTNYSSVSTSSLSSSFDPTKESTWGTRGQVTATRDPRILQVALRFDF